MLMKKLAIFFPIILGWFISIAQVSPFIHVDQFGYKVNEEKVAVFSNPIVGFNSFQSYQAPASAEIRNALDQQIIFTGPVLSWKNGQTQVESGDQGWWFDFSSVKDTGSFYIFDPVNKESSNIFRISDNPYKDILKAAGRMFYYNRCNDMKITPFADPKWTDGMNFMNPLQDFNCRYVFDKENISLERDMHGGWFDAGDYNKYVTFTYSTIHDLLYAFEENPQAFSDDWNIPESGNGIPDILDELKWELDWILRMINPDGSVHLKMGSIDYSDNASSPPSANTDPRYYSPVCSSASVTAASVLGHAAIVLKNIEGLEGYAGNLGSAAEQCFEYILPFHAANNWQTDCDDGTIKAGDADESAQGQLERAISASVYLYELTGLEKYNDFFIDNYIKSAPMSTGFWSGDSPTIEDALIRYSYHLNIGSNIVKEAVKQNLNAAILNNWNGFFGWSEEDLYRAFTPTWTYHWGSNKPKAAYGSLNMAIARYNMVSDSLKYAKKAFEQLHYFHGVNPLGLVMLSNMYQYGAEKCVNEIYHTWFYDGTIYDNALSSSNGPAPGFVTGGPNANFSVPNLTPPSGQPAMKSYLDFNNGWPDNSWEISEPAIYSQAAYIRLLANQVGEEITTAVQNPIVDSDVQFFPNPASGILQFKGIKSICKVIVSDLLGNELLRLSGVSNGTTLNISNFQNGYYRLIGLSYDSQIIFINSLVIIH